MENPPDLIVVNTSDEQNQDKKKLSLDNHQDNKQHDESSLNFQSNKYALECQLRQLRSQLCISHNTEFDEQCYLLQQRFQDEIHSIIHRHTESVQHTAKASSTYVTNVLQKSMEDINSLRLLHQKELSTQSKMMTECIQEQSFEMEELCHHLIDQHCRKPMNLLDTVIDDFRDALNDLKISFDSKINYLSDIHSSAIEKLNTKHQTEINEIKCELTLMSNRLN